jgi:N-acetylneuraminic acid mutarotase
MTGTASIALTSRPRSQPESADHERARRCPLTMVTKRRRCWLWALMARIAGGADVWIDVNENPNYLGRHECSFVQAGNKFYVLGGREDAKRVDRYDYASNAWSTGAPAPKEFNHFQAVTYEGLIWVVGAFNTNKYPNEVPEPNVYVYDPAANVWMAGPAIPASRRRGGAGLAVYNDQFYVVGGNTLGHTGGATGSVKFLDRYDPRTNAWQELADAPNARDHFHAVVVDSSRRLYNIGGRATDLPNVFDKTVAAVDVYDLSSGAWSTLTNVSLPSPRAGASSAVFEGRILVIGGESNTQVAAFKNVDAFDPATQSFASLAPLKYGRHGTQALVSGSGVIITGGSPTRGGGYQTNMEAYSQFAPVGVASSAGILRGPIGSVAVTRDQLASVTLSHSSGNTGIYIQNISVQGTDAAAFNLPSAPSVPFLVGTAETRTVFVRYSGNKALASAGLVVAYSGSSTLSLALQGINPNPLPTKRPSKQPTLKPTPTPPFRIGKSSFPADGNALRAAVVVRYRLACSRNFTINFRSPLASHHCFRIIEIHNGSTDATNATAETFSQLVDRVRIPDQLLVRTVLFYSAKVCHPPLLIARTLVLRNVSKVTNFRDVFRARDSTDPKAGFNESLTFWNTSSGTSMAGMFTNALVFDQDLVSVTMT